MAAKADNRLSELRALMAPINVTRDNHKAAPRKHQQKVVAYFAGMPEAERRCLAPDIMRWHKGIRLQDNATPASDLIDIFQVSVALAATATLSELQKIKWLGAPAMMCHALIDRRPGWLHEAIEFLFEQNGNSFGVGSLAREVAELVAAGKIDTPRHDHFVIGIAYSYLDRDRSTPLVDSLRADLPLIEPAIWRQFEVEGGGEVSLAQFDKYMAAKVGGGWAGALKQLADEGALDRGRLLDASLDALNCGFAQFRAGWFSRFHEMMTPTIEERAQRAGAYADLLASPVPPTVSLAIAALTQVQKAGRLDGDLLIERLEPALLSKTVATVRGALSLLAPIADGSPKTAAAAVRLAALTLEHGKVEVQAAGLDLIERHQRALDTDARAALDMRRNVISASLRPRLEALLSKQKRMPASEPKPTRAAPKTADAKTVAAGLPPDLRRLAGVDAALVAMDTLPADVPRAVFNGMEIPRLSTDTVVVPIATFEELIDEALVAIEHPDDLDRVERVMAGALAFAADRPPNEVALLSPLARSLKRYRPRGSTNSHLATPRGALQIVLAALVSAEMIRFQVAATDPRAAIVLRTNAMAAVIRERTKYIQFSAPTHLGFWIDPVVLAEKSAAAAAKGAALPLGIADQSLALLRLAPDRRPEALKIAGRLHGEWGAALRYALGAEETIGTNAALWVAAARSRAPFDVDPKLAALPGNSLQGSDLPPMLDWHVSYPKVSESLEYARIALASTEPDHCGFGKGHVGAYRTFEPPTKTVAPEECLTTVSLCDPGTLKWLDTYEDGDMRHIGTWAPALWPQHPDPVFALGAMAACMLDGNAYFRPANEPLADGLKLILDPDVPIGRMALFMLCRGLNAIDPAAAQATVDALIALIDDGRLDGETLGAAMHDFLMTGLVFGKRWPDRLKEVARSSPLALLAIRRALERALHLGQPQRKLRDLHAWLETLHELSSEAGEAVSDPVARDGIAVLADGGKSKTAARAVLALATAAGGGIRAEAARHAIDRRIERARRWADLR